jgi:hypothetical protein
MRTHPRRPMKTFLASLLAALAVSAMTAGAARAQEFVKVNEAAQEHIPAVPFVAIAYGFIWVAVLAYVLVLAGKVARARRDVDDLRRRLARTETDMPPRK